MTGPVKLCRAVIDVTLASFDDRIDYMTNDKLKIDCRQALDKARHWSDKALALLNDLDVYLAVFGKKDGD